MKKFIVILLLVLPLLFFGAVWFVGHILTSPVNQQVGNCPQDLVCENVEFPSESGSTIKGWLIKSAENKGVIVLMHGVRGNRNMQNRINFLHKAGYNILTFDFQAHGESIGKQITLGHLESRDAVAAINIVSEKLPNEKIGVIGISMGGAAFLLAKEQPKVDALVLEMVYPTMQKAIENRLNLWLFSGAESFSPILTKQFPMRLGISVDELRPIDKMKDIKIPTLFIAGENDMHTTLEESKQLFNAANEPKELWIVANAKHEDLFKISPYEYEQKILEFLEKNLRK